MAALGSFAAHPLFPGNCVHSLIPRFIAAGVVLVIAGAAIGFTREGVGPDAPWIGGLVAAIGGGLIASGITRHWNRPD